MNNYEKVKKVIKSMPDTPGVYLMKDAGGAVLYVGKAKSLRKRLLSYVRNDLDVKTRILMGHIADIEYRLTQTESLALLLEASLIHQYIPRYNVSLRDDKSFPYIKITNEEFPLVCITRQREPDGASYFGPYTSGLLLREALKTLRRLFPLRSCRQLLKKPCMYYRIGLCFAPCAGKISREDYGAIIDDVILILKGGIDTLVKKLSARMRILSQERNFEEAARVRDQINSLGAIEKGSIGFGYSDELEDLKGLLNLLKVPQRIEAFDISNTSGRQATGSMVSFWRALPDKSSYRRFRIKTIKEVNDYAMLQEVVTRRYSRLVYEKKTLPDLILIDGGKAHLAVAQSVLKTLGLRVPLISIAKEFENIYIWNKEMPVRLKEGSPALNLIRRIRDEAHRFAVTYHRLLRQKKCMGNA